MKLIRSKSPPATAAGVGDPTDLPAPLLADGTAATMISLLKALCNKNYTIHTDTGDIVTNTADIEVLLGALDAAKEIDPDAASASINALTRGALNKIIALETLITADAKVVLNTTAVGLVKTAVDENKAKVELNTTAVGLVTSSLSALLGALADAKETDPDAASASLNSLIRGILAAVNTSTTVDGSFESLNIGTISAPAGVAAVDLTADGKNLKNHVFTFNIAGIGTSLDLTLEGATDGGANFVQLAADGEDTQYTADGNYMLRVSDIPLTDIRLISKAEVGGTPVVSNIDYRGSN